MAAKDALDGMGRFQMVRLDQMVTDGRFNRPVREAHINRIHAHFRVRAVGVMELWKREDGKFVILDGQHRRGVFTKLGIPEDVKCIPAVVHDGLTLDEAAELFVLLNATKIVSAADKFRALRTAGHSETCDIDRIVRGQGLQVRLSSKSTDGTIGAVGALIDSYRLGQPRGAVLAATLAALHGSWGDAQEAYSSSIIKGTALFFHEHRDATPDEVVRVLVNKLGQPINLMGRARAVAGTQRMSTAQAVAKTIEDQMARKGRAGIRAAR